MRVALLTALLALSACATPQQLEMQRQSQAQADVNQCLGYGLHPESEGFAHCRMQLDLARNYQRNAYYRDPYPRLYTGFGYYHHRHR